MCNKIKPMSKEHFQYMKGIAILMVIIGHVGNFSGKTWFTPLGGIGVAMFLFCSGYGVMKSYQAKGLRRFWQNKLIAVYCPFVIVEIIAAVVEMRCLPDVILEFLFLKRLHPYGWYLQYLFICYAVFYFGIRFISNRKARYSLWCVIALCSFLFCSNLQGEQALSFLSGLFVAEYVYDEKSISFNHKYMLTGVGLICLSVILLAIKQLPAVRVYAHIYTLFNLCLKTSCVAGVLLVSGWNTMFKRTICIFGALSYALYLVHGYFMWIVSDNMTGYYLLNALVLLVVSVAVAIMLNQIVVILQKRKA